MGCVTEWVAIGTTVGRSMAEVVVSGWEPVAACPASAEGRGLSCRPEQASVELVVTEELNRSGLNKCVKGESPRERESSSVRCAGSFIARRTRDRQTERRSRRIQKQA